MSCVIHVDLQFWKPVSESITRQNQRQERIHNMFKPPILLTQEGILPHETTPQNLALFSEEWLAPWESRE